MSQENNNGSGSVGIVAIVAIVVLVGVASWFIWGRPNSRPAPMTGTTSQPAKTGVEVKINLPDSVTIK